MRPIPPHQLKLIPISPFIHLRGQPNMEEKIRVHTVITRESLRHRCSTRRQPDLQPSLWILATLHSGIRLGNDSRDRGR